jgi:hypothetical protein
VKNEERTDTEIIRLEAARQQLERDESNLGKLQQRRFDKDFYRKLRELEGSEMDGPLNFAWRIDFPHVLSGAPSETIRGEFSLVNQTQRQQDLVVAQSGKADSGFDLIIGNPPFVTARNRIKRELYRERWPRVCYKNYQLVCPFFEMSFGLLRPRGQLGFIASNAFAKREFGEPLVEDFFPTVDLQKVVDCSGLMFPGHGTPTCLVFGAQCKPDKRSLVRVAAILPGGGDLRTMPEESPLWHTLGEKHDQAGFRDDRVAVGDYTRSEVAKWPWNFYGETGVSIDEFATSSSETLGAFTSESVGHVAITRTDDVFILPPDLARRSEIEPQHLRFIGTGETIRNWSPLEYPLIVFPYNTDLSPLDPAKSPRCISYLKPYRSTLENVVMHGSVRKKETNVKWFEYSRLARAKFKVPHSIVLPEIATHNHAIVDDGVAIFHQTVPVIKLSATASEADHLCLTALLNSSAALFWLKQVCFNKGAGEDEHRDRFVYAGGKVQQLPIPAAIADALRGKDNSLADALTTLSCACSGRGCELPSLALRKLFEKPNEAYHAWNAALPGYVKPHKEHGAPFATKKHLAKNLSRTQEIRGRLRGEMIARQEEMDWVVYAAYGLIDNDDPAAQVETEPTPLDQAQRPFRLWQVADGDFTRAVKLIPADWPKSRRTLWEARLAAIRDNEHIRRIEQPVYKRRWDEQWKVGNRWECGPAAYAQELIDAFTWWLSEKAEWHLEHKAKGGPIALPDWSSALFKDARVAAAWDVVADAIYEVEKYKWNALDDEKKESRKKPKLDDSYTAFERFFRDTILDQSVAHGIPPAKPWNELSEKKTWTPAQMKKAQAVRGKLNVPRERFQQMSPTHFVWAGAS